MLSTVALRFSLDSKHAEIQKADGSIKVRNPVFYRYVMNALYESA